MCPVTIRMLSYREACETAEFGEVQRWSNDDGDEIPITDLAKALKDTDTVDSIPEGQDAVGAGIARDFGKDLGVFKGKVMNVQAVRTMTRNIYHVVYEDGDSEDFDLDEYRYQSFLILRNRQQFFRTQYFSWRVLFYTGNAYKKVGKLSQ